MEKKHRVDVRSMSYVPQSKSINIVQVEEREAFKTLNDRVMLSFSHHREDDQDVGINGRNR